jgi:hypothetical protein
MNQEDFDQLKLLVQSINEQLNSIKRDIMEIKRSQVQPRPDTFHPPYNPWNPPFPIKPVLPYTPPTLKEQCHVCGIKFSDAMGYVCGNGMCPSRVVYCGDKQ